MAPQPHLKSTLCSHQQYISYEMFRARNVNITPYKYPELKRNICKDCGKDISHLDLYYLPHP